MDRFRGERGATAVEYALMVGGIAGAILAVVFLLGTPASGLFEGFVTQMELLLG